MWYQTIERLITIVGGKDPGDPDFGVSGQIFIYGDKGFFFSAHGRGFYILMREHGPAIMAKHQLASIEGYVLPHHRRLMQAVLVPIFDVRAIHRGQMAGHDAIWMRVTLAGAELEDPDRTLDLRVPPV